MGEGRHPAGGHERPLGQHAQGPLRVRVRDRAHEGHDRFPLRQERASRTSQHVCRLPHPDAWRDNVRGSLRQRTGHAQQGLLCARRDVLHRGNPHRTGFHGRHGHPECVVRRPGHRPGGAGQLVSRRRRCGARSLDLRVPRALLHQLDPREQLVRAGDLRAAGVQRLGRAVGTGLQGPARTVGHHQDDLRCDPGGQDGITKFFRRRSTRISAATFPWPRAPRC